MAYLNSKTSRPLLGEDPLEIALARQWVVFQTDCLDVGAGDKRELYSQLRRVNENLANKSFLAGDQLTAADVLLFHR